MDEKMENSKRILIFNVINFLNEQLLKGNLIDEKKESVEVALQCLEEAFDLDSRAREQMEKDKIDLLALISKKEVSDEDKQNAENFKNEGNAAMRGGDYAKAVELYTKAIQYNPSNAIYYCNRAAAYSRLDRHIDAISDCREAIKLDPQYGKAYSRLGVAYSNLNRFEEAKNAYETALKFDPNNTLFETNLKIAEEKLAQSSQQSNSSQLPFNMQQNFQQFMNSDLVSNPAVINAAWSMLNDESFRNVMRSVVEQNVDMDTIMQLGQNLATRIQSTGDQRLGQLFTNDPNMPEGSSTTSENANTQAGPNTGSEKPSDSEKKNL